MKNSPEIYAIDANVVLRYLLRDHTELSTKANDIFANIENGAVIVELDPINLAEIIFVMQKVYKQKPTDIAAAMLALIQHEHIIIEGKERYIRALHLYAGGITHFGDACACSAAIERSEGRLLSFDRKLSNVPGVLRREHV